ncbi:hypothetical protein [Jidongwangia harbinensis]|uniref:hypothetical protein n=1 Tax=Jidongwangia harbinensis TaxID=2878561 RepID=UPI001CDA2A24|nr:hypothetical protein [Jidongwangia harbinensis]MCA2211460.1 hypothetical protein [Jidongwangia harbinensis]
MRRMPMLIAAGTAAATLAIGGCSTDQPPVCESLAAVQTTMNQIRTTNVSENGLAPLKAHLQQLKTDVYLLLTDAGAQFAPEVEAVRTAADQVSASVAMARETPDVANLSAVRTTLQGLQTSLRGLADAMSGTC